MIMLKSFHGHLYVPDHFKTQSMRDDAVKKGFFLFAGCS